MRWKSQKKNIIKTYKIEESEICVNFRFKSKNKIMTTIAEINNNSNITNNQKLICSDEEKKLKHEQALRKLTETFFGIEKPLKGAKSVTSMSALISELHQVFDSDSVNIEYVNHLLISYKSNPAEWKKYAKFDRYR